MKAILSDIHGNLEALEAVLADAKAFGATEIYCLGDLIGYGPNPIECVQHAMSWKVVIKGNFEQVAMFVDDLDAAGWVTMHHAKTSIYKFRRLLKQGNNDAIIGEFLRGLPRTHSEGNALYVHGSARNPLNEYVFPEDTQNQLKLERISSCFDKLSIAGHTHIPGVFSNSRFGTWEFLSPEDCNHEFPVGPGKLIFNVGSVGQPRDSNPKASYALFDGQAITFRRVEYDMDRTIQKIKDDDDYGDFNGERLGLGR